MKNLIPAFVAAAVVAGCGTFNNIDQDHNKQCKENCSVTTGQPAQVIIQPVDVQKEVVEKIVTVPVYIDRETRTPVRGECRIVHVTEAGLIKKDTVVEFGPSKNKAQFYFIANHIAGGGLSESAAVLPSERLRYCPDRQELTADGVRFTVVPQ